MFDKVVGLMKAGKYKTASDLVCKNWLGRLHQYYQPFGDLHIQNNKPGDAAGYKRALNISDAVATTVYKQNGATNTNTLNSTMRTANASSTNGCFTATRSAGKVCFSKPS